MKANKRLDQLEVSLTSEQILMRRLDETLKFNSREDFALWVAEEPRERRAVAIFVRDLMPQRGTRPRETDRERRRRLKGAAEYLCCGYQLFEGVNHAVEEQSSLAEIAVGLAYETEQLEQELVASEHRSEWFPVPVRQDLAATIKTALEDYVMPLRDFCSELRSRMKNSWAEIAPTGSSIYAEEQREKLTEFCHALASVGALKTGWWVDLSPFPYRSLGAASLVDGRWIDRRLLELGEFAALLVARDFRLQDPPYSHPLEPMLIVNDAGRLASEQELQPIRIEAENRLKLFKRRIKKIRGDVYVDINDYRCWKGRAVVGELEPIQGIDVAHWNRWFDSLGGDGRAEIAGVQLHRLRSPFWSSDFVACEDDIDLANRSGARQLVQLNFQRQEGCGAKRALRWTQLRQRISSTLKALFATSELVQLAERVFNGHPVLFNCTMNLHNSRVAMIEAVADQFNEMSAIYSDAPNMMELGFEQSQIELDALRADAKIHAEGMLKAIKEHAQVATLQMLGRDEAALGLSCRIVTTRLAEVSAAMHARTDQKAPSKQRKSALDRFLDRTMKERKREGQQS